MEYNKRIASLKNAYKYYFQAAFSLKYLLFKKLPKAFRENIMLAVTEVNGCKMCSVAHAKMALESGMSEEEIKCLLKADLKKINKAYLIAVLFSQEYASTCAKPSQKSLIKLQETYQENYKSIIASIRMIMLGNTMGIAYDIFTKRLKKNHFSTSIWRDLAIIIGYIILLPLFIITFILGLFFS